MADDVVYGALKVSWAPTKVNDMSTIPRWKKRLPWSAYGLGLLLWLVLGALTILLTEKGALHQALNGLPAGSWSDQLFEVLTYVGDRRLSWFVGAVFLLQRQYRAGGAILVAAIATGLSIEWLKHQVFGPMPRPVAFFGDPTPLRLVPGFENKLEYTMPSGHAALAFALMTSLALQARGLRWQQVGFLALALLAGFSRVYLSEHFFEDVYAGSWLGVGWALAAWILLRRPALRQAAVAEAVAGNGPQPDAPGDRRDEST